MIEVSRTELETAAKSKEDCRLCIHYQFERSCEVEFFECKRGYYRFADYGSSERNEGEMNWFGCKGNAFSLDMDGHFWHVLGDNIIDGAMKEKRNSAFRSLIPTHFDEGCKSLIFSALEDAIIWNIRPTRMDYASDVDKIAAFSFGYGPSKNGIGQNCYSPEHFHPGKSNDAIANIINDFIHKAPHVKQENIYAQWEIAESLKRHGIYLDEAHIAKPAGKYLGTRGVAEMFYDNGLNQHRTIAVFAHPMHLYRCLGTLDKLSLDRGSRCRLFVPDCNMVPFDNDSVQEWTKNILLWIIHEISSRAYARSKGEL
jgi:hypothetical protein